MAALTTLGFKKAECRRALGELTSCDDALSMEELIRHALALLVPA
ncbi:MAG: RuvA C-terminal domain-containing protein [Polyangiaceae bacterium]